MLIDTFQAYDLWRHNCNNFSNDFAIFLTGRGIPSYITSMPDTVLNSPFGRLFQPSIDDMIRNNHNRRGGLLGIEDEAFRLPPTTHQIAEAVKKPENLQHLDSLLASQNDSCAVVFFTSDHCAPCKTLYSLYADLGAEFAHKCAFIKVDINRAPDATAKLGIRSTPTFVTFLHGQEENRWSGADAAALNGNVRMLVQMAWPPHPHESLRLPQLQAAATHPIIYRKVPPLDKLVARIGDQALAPPVQAVKHFINITQAEGAAESPLPDLDAFSRFLRKATETVPIDNLFAVFDLFRIAMSDTRVAGYYAEEKDHKTVVPLLTHVNSLPNCPKGCPYALRLVALQLACNFFASPLYVPHILTCSEVRRPIIELATGALLDSKHHSVRVAAASLILNIASANAQCRTHERREALPEDDTVELAAGLLESIGTEEDSLEALRGFLMAFGQLVYCVPEKNELAGLLDAMDAKGMLESKKEKFPDEVVIKEVLLLLEEE